MRLFVIGFRNLWLCRQSALDLCLQLTCRECLKAAQRSLGCPARQLRKKWPDARLLACTGHANVDLGKDHGELGFDGWLAKPFTVKALSDAVRSVAAGDDDAPA